MPEILDWRLPPFEVDVQFIAQSEIVDWGVASLGFFDLWPEFGNGAGAIVAVLDTGQPEHSDLIPALGIAKDFTGSTRGTKDLNGHSTHCCGIIAAQSNDQGTRGGAPGATILCGKVLGDSGSGSSAGVAAGIDWANSQGVDVISMSLGSPSPDPTILAAIGRLPPTTILCCAAGNSGPGENTGEYPGRWDRALAVCSINQLRQVSRFSSRDPANDISAPGEKITSCWLQGQVATLSGTSMATPHIAAAAAIFKAYCKQRGFSLTHKIFADLLETSADDIGAPGVDTASGFGIANLKNLGNRLKELIGAPTPPSPPSAGGIVFDPSDFSPTGLAKAKRVVGNLASISVKL